MSKTPRNLRGMCWRLGFKGYRAFMATPPNYQVHPPGTKYMLHYRDYNLATCDYFAKNYGYFPGPEDIGEYAVKDMERRERHAGTKFKLAFVNDGEYQNLWNAEWYLKDQIKRGLD